MTPGRHRLRPIRVDRPVDVVRHGIAEPIEQAGGPIEVPRQDEALDRRGDEVRHHRFGRLRRLELVEQWAHGLQRRGGVGERRFEQERCERRDGAGTGPPRRPG